MLWFQVLKKAVQKFAEDNTFYLGATIAFYTIFSLPAISIISIEIAGFFYEDAAVQQQVHEQLKFFIGENSAEQISKIVKETNVLYDSVFMQLFGIGTLLFSATTVFAALQQSLNTIWKIKPKPKKGYVKFIINRLLSLAMVGTIGFMLMTTLLIDTLLVVLNQTISYWISDFAYFLIFGINTLLSLFIVTVIFALIFKVLPDANIKWKDTWKGAFLTTLLFSGGKYIIEFYLSQSDVGSAYGAAGSLVAILTWVYYSTLIILFGAIVTYVYIEERGSVIRPSKHAVRIKLEEIEKDC